MWQETPKLHGCVIAKHAQRQRAPCQRARPLVVHVCNTALLAAAPYLLFCVCPQVEVEVRYAATLTLSNHKKEAAASEKRLKEAYEARIRDKQMELHAALSRLQVCC